MSAEAQDETIRFPDDSGRSFRELIASCPPGSVIELAPGRYVGPIQVTRPMTIRGAGDLTRIVGEKKGSVISVRVPRDGRVVLESLFLEEGAGEAGGGIFVSDGSVRIHNVHIRHCRTEGPGGALCIAGGEVEVTRLRVLDTAGEKGGAVYVGGRSTLSLRDSQIKKAEARAGGALAIEGAARVTMESVTVSKGRATIASGGQMMWIAGTARGSPIIEMKRVRFEDAPMGHPIVVDKAYPGEIGISDCDLPRVVLGTHGVSDGGGNRWR
jgi:nitrous oxidase accessory protein NosD